MELRATVTTKGKIFEGKAPEIVQDALKGAMYEAVALLKREVKALTPTGVFGVSGGLVSTIHGEVLEMGKKGIIGHGSPYGDVIEMGRRPGQKWPPEGVLERWIEKKIGASGESVKGIEFLIRRKIGRKGFPGVHMFEKAFKANYGKLVDIFQRAGFKITREINE